MDIAIYTRLSLDKAGTGESVSAQEDTCRAYAAERGWTVAQVFSDNDTSATTGVARPGFEALLASRFRVVVVWAQDRLLRVSKDLERVIEARMAVHSVTAASLDLSRPQDEMLSRIVTAVSTFEGRHKAERMRAAFLKNAKAGQQRWMHRPFGFERDTTHRPDEAAALRGAYRTILDGGPLAQVARDLNAAGLPATTGRPWDAKTVRQILLADRNWGGSVYRGDVVGTGAWEPIVDEATFAAVRSILTAPSRTTTGVRGPGRKHLLSGIALCSKCGAVLRTAFNNGTRIYRCTAANHLGRMAEPIEAALLEETLALLIYPGAREAMTDAPALDPALLEERATLTHRRDVELPAGLAVGLSALQVAQATKTINERLAVIDAAVAQARKGSLFEEFWASPDGWPEVMEGARAVWDGLPLHKRQSLVTALWAGVIALGGRGAPVLLVPSDMTRALLEQVDAERERVAASRALTAALRDALRA